ncbi:hypothetical protein Hanom_Chr01g00093021 [Helianthus anomalus]
MSWFSNYILSDYSEDSVVPDSYFYEGTAISPSYDILIPSNMMEEEVVSGIHYRDSTVQLDLNVERLDAHHDYSDYGYGGEPYPQAEYPYSQPNYPNHGYGGEQSYV